MLRAMIAVLALLFAVNTQATTWVAQSDLPQVGFEAEVAATATALSMGPYDVARYTNVTCQMVAGTGDTRSFIASCVNGSTSAATVTYAYPTVSVAASAKAQWALNPLQPSTTASTSTTVAPHPLCRYIKFTAASGAALTVSCTFRNR
jgi:hypothetical protein